MIYNYQETIEKVYALEQVSGQSIDSLISAFAAGCELTPKPIFTMKSLCMDCNGSGYVSLGPGIRGIKRCPRCNGLKHV